MALWGFAAPRVSEHELVSVTFVTCPQTLSLCAYSVIQSILISTCCVLDDESSPSILVCINSSPELLYANQGLLWHDSSGNSWKSLESLLSQTRFISLLICAENVSRWPQTGVCPARCSSVMTVEGEKWSLLTAPLAHTTKTFTVIFKTLLWPERSFGIDQSKQI